MIHLHNPFEDRKEGRQRNLFGIGGTGGGLNLDIGGSDPFGRAFSGIFGSPSRGGSQQRIQEFAPTETATRISQLLEGIFGGGGGGFNQPGAGFEAFQNELTNPSFAPQTSSEQALINDLITQTQGASAIRGLGPATGGAVAQNIAPTLVQQRQQRLGNLFGGAQLGEQARGTDLRALLEGLGLSAGLAQPERIVLGSSQQTGGSPGLFSQLGGFLGGTGKFLSGVGAVT